MGWGPEMKKGERRAAPLQTPIDRERLFGGERRRRSHVDLDLAAAALAERHDAVGGGEQRVVAADADIVTGVHLGAALTDQDVAREDLLAAEALHTQPLALRIAAVTRRAACFLMCHDELLQPLSGDDLLDLDHRQVLTMAVLAP